VPDINDFVAGMKVSLKNRGVTTMEFPHLLRLVEGNQFDTIYHEHFSYFSFMTVEKIFASHGITLSTSKNWTTHGGSIRIFGRHAEVDTGKHRFRQGSGTKGSEIRAGYELQILNLLFAFATRSTDTQCASFSES